MNLNVGEYRDKVLGCWLGKNIGGTIGAPFEWKRQVNDVSFYTQDLGGEPLPNDDLDIQLLWLVALEEKGPKLDAHILADYWLTYVTPHWSEYGICKANLRNGLAPPLSGTFNNDFRDSCGAFIRSEIWACIAPGNPRLAARYAYEDAIIDHGSGEGTYAEVFCAALESAAFVEKDISKLVSIALSYIPDDCGVAGAAKLAIQCRRSGKSWRKARDLMLEKYRGKAFFGWRSSCSKEDHHKGFFDGKLGWDVPSNIGMLLIGLLYGKGDLARSICTAVNCGEDTDCTAATVGSIFGILHGASAIPEKWIKPIGRKIKTACLNLGELGYFGNQLPANVDAMTERTLAVAREVAAFHHLPLAIGDGPTDAQVSEDDLRAGGLVDELYSSLRGPKYQFDGFQITVDYGQDGPVLKPGVPKAIELRVVSHAKYQTMLNVHWYLPEGMVIEPSADAAMLALQPWFGRRLIASFTLRADQLRTPVLRAAVEFVQPGRATVMHVPIVLLNGSGI